MPKFKSIASLSGYLRDQGFKPHFDQGRLVDWRKVNGEHALLIARTKIKNGGKVSLTITKQE